MSLDNLGPVPVLLNSKFPHKKSKNTHKHTPEKQLKGMMVAGIARRANTRNKNNWTGSSYAKLRPILFNNITASQFITWRKRKQGRKHVVLKAKPLLILLKNQPQLLHTRNYQQLRKAKPQLYEVISDEEVTPPASLTKTVFVSHRWETKDHPDPKGWQQKKLLEWLQTAQDVDYVFFDFWCIPQGDKISLSDTEWDQKTESIAGLCALASVAIYCPLWTTLIAPNFLSRCWCYAELVWGWERRQLYDGVNTVDEGTMATLKRDYELFLARVIVDGKKVSNEFVAELLEDKKVTNGSDKGLVQSAIARCSLKDPVTVTIYQLFDRLYNATCVDIDDIDDVDDVDDIDGRSFYSTFITMIASNLVALLTVTVANESWFDTICVCNLAGMLLKHNGHYTEAQRCYSFGLNGFNKDTNGENSLRIALLANLAVVYHLQKRFNDAEKTYRSIPLDCLTLETAFGAHNTCAMLKKWDLAVNYADVATGCAAIQYSNMKDRLRAEVAISIAVSKACQSLQNGTDVDTDTAESHFWTLEKLTKQSDMHTLARFQLMLAEIYFRAKKIEKYKTAVEGVLVKLPACTSKEKMEFNTKLKDMNNEFEYCDN